MVDFKQAIDDLIVVEPSSHEILEARAADGVGSWNFDNFIRESCLSSLLDDEISDSFDVVWLRLVSMVFRIIL